MPPTLNQVVDLIRAWARSHAQLNGVAWSARPDIFNRQDFRYAALFFNCRTGRISGNQIPLDFQFYILDRNTGDQRAMLEVHSDTLQIAGDLNAWLEDDDRPWSWKATGQLERFDSFSPDDLAGWGMSGTISIPYNSDSCKIPYRQQERVFTDAFADQFA